MDYQKLDEHPEEKPKEPTLYFPKEDIEKAEESLIFVVFELCSRELRNCPFYKALPYKEFRQRADGIRTVLWTSWRLFKDYSLPRKTFPSEEEITWIIYEVFGKAKIEEVMEEKIKKEYIKDLYKKILEFLQDALTRESVLLMTTPYDRFRLFFMKCKRTLEGTIWKRDLTKDLLEIADKDQQYLCERIMKEKNIPQKKTPKETNIPSKETNIPSEEAKVFAKETNIPSEETKIFAEDFNFHSEEADIFPKKIIIPSEESKMPPNFAKETNIPSEETNTPSK